MHEEQPTRAARPNEAMSDRLVLLLSLLLFLMLPLLPALPMLLLCCYQHRIGVLAGGGDAVHFFVSISERVQTMGARCHVYQSVPGIYIPVPVYDTRYQVLDKHAPRIPAPNTS